MADGRFRLATCRGTLHLGQGTRDDGSTEPEKEKTMSKTKEAPAWARKLQATVDEAEETLEKVEEETRHVRNRARGPEVMAPVPYWETDERAENEGPAENGTETIEDGDGGQYMPTKPYYEE